MVLESILGGLLGGVARLAPEVLAFLDKKEERKDKQLERMHELKLQEFSLNLTKLQNEGKLQVADKEIEKSQFEAAMSVLKAQVDAQSKPSGVKWVDGWAAAVRPGVTTWLFLLYAVVKAASISLALDASIPIDQAIVAMWGPEDSAMLSSVLMFWFIGRVWERTIPRVLPK